MKPGGTLISRRLMSPNVIASRCSTTASSGHPSINFRVGGSRTHGASAPQTN
jgi:hypothetical protein